MLRKQSIVITKWDKIDNLTEIKIFASLEHVILFQIYYRLTSPPIYSVRCMSKGTSTLLVLVLVFARLVLVGRLVWLLLVLVNFRPYYFSCSPGFGA
jgi:hypothetical protein